MGGGLYSAVSADQSAKPAEMPVLSDYNAAIKYVLFSVHGRSNLSHWNEVAKQERPGMTSARRDNEQVLFVPGGR